MNSPDEVMARHFPAYAAGDSVAAWKAVEAAFCVGDLVDGKIVAKFQFGLAIDCGAPLPGILLATRIPEISPEKLELDPRYRLGAQIKAHVKSFAKAQQQIALTQLPGDYTRES